MPHKVSGYEWEIHSFHEDLSTRPVSPDIERNKIDRRAHLYFVWLFGDPYLRFKVPGSLAIASG